MTQRPSPKAILRLHEEGLHKSAARLTNRLLHARGSDQSGPPDIAGPIRDLQSQLRALITDLADDPTSAAQAIRRALRDIDESLATLNESQTATDPAKVMSAMEAALRAFGRASLEAKRAGKSWVL
jgi:hypothetical protein